MPVPYSAEDLGRIFDARTLTRGRNLVLANAVEVAIDEETVTGLVRDTGMCHAVRLTPSQIGRRVIFTTSCECDRRGCAHLAATALAALDRFPALRKPQQQSFLDNLMVGPKAVERLRLAFHLSPGEPPFACMVTSVMEGDSGKIEPVTPRKILADRDLGDNARALARLLGGGEMSRTGVKPGAVNAVIGLLLESGQARWAPSGKRLSRGEERVFAANAVPNLPAKSGIILGDAGHWYADAVSGEIGRIRIRPTAPTPSPSIRRQEPPRRDPRRPASVSSSERVIVERPLTPVIKLRKLDCPDDFGRMQKLDALLLEFDYAGALTHADDERQFVRVEEAGGPVFVRRNAPGEAAAFEALRQDGFTQMRVSGGAESKGRRIFLFRGRDAAESWQRFVAVRVPQLEMQGWRSEIEGDFGPRFVESVGECDIQIGDAEAGEFSVEFGIEIDGARQNLLPILTHILDHGGIEGSQIVDGEIVIGLEDGRILKLPAERIRRLLETFADLIDQARRRDDKALILPASEAPALLELEDLLTTRWQNAAAIQSYLARFRDGAEIPHAAVPASFTASLRPYQQQGVDWLQHLREHNLAGILADDMGLGKTAQAIAHIVIEEAAGRLDRPVLIVVPTSLVPNWTAELGKFAPHLKIEVLHGLDRHERRSRMSGIHVVITTYTVLSRDIEMMKEMPWHMVVLDEAQAIKSPDAKATRAVCQLDTRHKVCLSGTPIENNLDELWSEFAFLMPGLLGDRKGFSKRFRTPIEKKNDLVRRRQLVQRIRPFILRRTKSEVATELPPKHTVLRRVDLAPEQRELYEGIRAMLHEDVREQIAARGLGQSRIVVLDALLKLRQACCDPRLVKLASARDIEVSSKLDDLMEMLTEMIPEGRRVLLFSQFTSMLDLIKPRLAEAGITYVELRGDTRDRAEPVRAFEAGEVPLFLISLKAGGRGLNLVSADTVIHYDPWWNPAVEEQASDRAHRIGQTKSVFVYKLIAAGTVEEKMVELQQRKAALAGVALGSDDEVQALELDDIDYLFGPELDQQAA
ncbi:MAG TPA: DEAD/DEAH box helicase [Aliidongia sp.]|nr:DEAD/DEAH box helicase [Aliidongia sp.]